MGGNKDKNKNNINDNNYDEKPSILSWKDHRGILIIIIMIVATNNVTTITIIIVIII